MHRIEETKYGYKVTFEGFLHRDDAGAFLDDLRGVVRPRGDASPFAALVDMRNSRAWKQAITFCKQTGMERNAVVLNSAIATLQARRLARETGTDVWSRYIDASSEPEWERVAVEWLMLALEPDRRYN